jgi:hypothetical protein
VGGAERRPRPDRGYYTVEEKALIHFQKLQESLQWKDDQPPDPYKVHQALAVIALEVHPQTDRGEVWTPDHEAFTENMAHVRDAFALVAYPYMSEGRQMSIRIMYGYREGQELTITPQQNRMLTMITTAAGIEDNPELLTYSYSAVFKPTAPGNGQGKARR